MAPPSSGGSTEGEILNILNGYSLGSEPRVRGSVPLPRGVPARLRRPQRLRRRPRLRPRAARRPARSGVRGDAPLPDRQYRAHLAGRSRLAVRPVPGLQRHRGVDPGLVGFARGAPHEQHRHRGQVGRHRRLHEHDQLLRRQRPGRARLWLPAQRRADRLRFRPALARRVRPEPAGGRQGAAVEHGPGHRAARRQARSSRSAPPAARRSSRPSSRSSSTTSTSA